MYRFAFSWRWMLAHLLVIVAVVSFAFLGRWQLHRLSDRRATNAMVAASSRRPVAPLDAVLRDGGPAYRLVDAAGTYDPAREVVLRSRALKEEPGHHLLTPLLLDDGRALVVDRGWVPFDLDTPPVARAAPPAGTVRVTGFLMPSEARPGSAQRPSHGVVSRVDVAALSGPIGRPVVPLYLLLRSQEPAQPGQLPVAVELEPRGDGPHLPYAIQWFAFIPTALVCYGAFLRAQAKRR